MNNDKLDLWISSMKRERLGSRKDKIRSINQHQLMIQQKFKEFSKDDFKELVLSIESNKPPTIDSIREKLVNGVTELYEAHNFKHSVLKHNCCFEEYYFELIALIKLVMSKEHLEEWLFKSI